MKAQPGWCCEVQGLAAGTALYALFVFEETCTANTKLLRKICFIENDCEGAPGSAAEILQICDVDRPRTNI